MAAVAPGVIAEVSVRIISVDNTALTANVRVIDNNGTPITPQVTLPQGVVRPVAFQVAVGDVLEHVGPDRRTAVVRWIDTGGETWSESPTGTPAHDTVGWARIGTFVLP